MTAPAVERLARTVELRERLADWLHGDECPCPYMAEDGDRSFADRLVLMDPTDRLLLEHRETVLAALRAAQRTVDTEGGIALGEALDALPPELRGGK